MRRLLAFLMLTAALGVGGAWFLDRLAREGPAPPTMADDEPGPEDPPVVWVAGEVESLGSDEIGMRAEHGPLVRLRRLAGGSTRFLKAGPGGWEPAPFEEVTGRPACVQAFLDAERLVAIAAYVGAASCGPTG